MPEIETPFGFEVRLSGEEFQKIGQFACRWAHIEHTVGNCLRVLLGMAPDDAQVMVFPLSLDARVQRINEVIKKRPLPTFQATLFSELKPLLRAQQYLRNTVLHGVVIDLFLDEEPFFHLRSKGRDLTKAELFSCEDLINYTAHVAQALRLSLGEKDLPNGYTYALPDRPDVPDFLPGDCRNFPPDETVMRRSRPDSWIDVQPINGRS